MRPAGFVQELVELPIYDSLFLPGISGCNLFKGVPNTPVLAMRLNFGLGGKAQ